MLVDLSLNRVGNAPREARGPLGTRFNDSFKRYQLVPGPLASGATAGRPPLTARG